MACQSDFFQFFQIAIKKSKLLVGKNIVQFWYFLYEYLQLLKILKKIQKGQILSSFSSPWIRNPNPDADGTIYKPVAGFS
jgi:hypothetical protein